MSAIEFKSAPFTLLVLPVHDGAAFASQLADKLSQLKGFFSGDALVLDFAESPTLNQFAFADVAALCRAASLNLVGVRHVNPVLQVAAEKTGLSVFPDSAVEKSAKSPEPVAPEPSLPPHAPAKIIDKPVRAGQQVYAKGGDLIILSDVSAGAEVLADGSVHIYGSLRGKAHAGVSGDVTARVFAQTIEAEMLSVAGCYRTLDMTEKYEQPAQVYLEGNRLLIKTIT